jgi:hypothetical protein
VANQQLALAMRLRAIPFLALQILAGAVTAALAGELASAIGVEDWSGPAAAVAFITTFFILSRLQ